MVIKNKNRKASIFDKKWLIASGTVIILISAYVLAAHSQSWWPFSTTGINDPNAQQQQTVNTSPKNNNSIKTTPADKDEGKTSDQIPTSTTLAATITDVVQDGSNVDFNARIDNSTGAGTCVITFTNPNDRPVTKQIEATYKAGTSLCGPLKIPAYEFSFLGQWDVALHYYENSEQVTATSQVTIQ